MNPPSRQPREPLGPQAGGPSPNSRERALGLLRRCNRFIIGGAVALTALLTEVAAQAFPGKTLATTKGAGTTSHARSRAGEASKSSTTQLQPPAEAPREPTTTPTETNSEAPQQSSEPPPQSSEQTPQSSEPSSPSETPATPAPVEERPAQETAPPVVSGGS